MPNLYAQYTLGPLRVVAIETAISGYAIALSDGSGVHCDEAAAIDLEPFIDTDHALWFTCDRIHGAWRLVSFAWRMAD